MWTQFLLAVIVGVLFLYLPGLAFGRALRLSGVACVACAPLFSVAVCQVICIVLGMAGVACSWALVLFSALALSLAVAAAGEVLARRRVRNGTRGVSGAHARVGRANGRQEQVAGGAQASDAAADATEGGCVSRMSAVRFDWLCLAGYVVAGVVVGLYAFVAPLGDPTQFAEGLDNAHHLNAIRSFVDSGVWSSLSVTLYPEGAGADIDPMPGVSFYPSGWHMVAAMVVQLVGCEVVVAEHAVNFAFIAFVFATSMFLMMRVIFRGNRVVVALGTLLAFSFAMFPWSFTYFGPLYPNLASYAAMPAVAACFIAMLEDGVARRERVSRGVAFFVGMVALVLLQTNAVFSVAAFLIAFCVWRVWSASSDVSRGVRVARCAGFVVFALAVWTALFYAPPLRAVVTHEWVAFESYRHGVFDVATMGFRGTMQLGLAFLALVGAVSTLGRGGGRRYVWVTASMTLFGIMYVVDVASNDFIKFFLTGFWYTDSYRVAASAVLAVVPLASWGAYCVLRAARSGLAHVMEGAGLEASGGRRRGGAARVPGALACALVALIAASVYAPGSVQLGDYRLSTAFQNTRDAFGGAMDTSVARVYDLDEQAFVDKVAEVVPEGAGIVNEPNDGSGFSYGTDGLNVMYRTMRDVGGSGESEQSALIRERLDEVASDDEVRDAVHDLGVEYVLQLDHAGGDEDATFLFCYEPQEWEGIDAVDDVTPGFEVVLSEGDMRLYRIAA